MKKSTNKKELGKKWFQSKTKWAALLIGVGPVLATLGQIFNGTIDMNTGVYNLVAQVGIVLGIFGMRDLPFINKK